jgi:hypothetical protein
MVLITIRRQHSTSTAYEFIHYRTWFVTCQLLHNTCATFWCCSILSCSTVNRSNQLYKVYDLHVSRRLYCMQLFAYFYMSLMFCLNFCLINRKIMIAELRKTAKRKAKQVNFRPPKKVVLVRHSRIILNVLKACIIIRKDFLQVWTVCTKNFILWWIYEKIIMLVAFIFID